VTEEILAIEADAAGLGPMATPDGPTRDPDSLSWLVSRLFDRVTSAVAIPEAAVRDYYERNLDRFWIPETRRVRHVLVADRATARWLIGRLRRGARLAALARRHSLDAASRTSGGDIGDVRHGELVGPLEDALFSAPLGALVGPIPDEHGWHVARVESLTPEGHVPFDEVRATIVAELLETARHEAFGDWLEARRAHLAIMEPEFPHPADPRHGIPTHRH
jgi:parvulin-like peptidyl-prolyl isomerase